VSRSKRHKREPHVGQRESIDDSHAFRDQRQSSTSAWPQIPNEQAKLLASDAPHTNRFGRSVALDADTVLIGSQSGQDDEGVDTGSADRASGSYGHDPTVRTDRLPSLDDCSFSGSERDRVDAKNLAGEVGGPRGQQPDQEPLRRWSGKVFQYGGQVQVAGIERYDA